MARRQWRRRGGVYFGALALIASWASAARAEFTIGVAFDDPSGTFAGREQALRANVIAAGETWGRYFAGTTALNVVVQASGIATAGGMSTATVPIGREGGFQVELQGAASKILTGVGANGTGPDAVIFLNPYYLADELYLDPNPGAGPAVIPGDRTDAYSVILHEFGHILAFNGDRAKDTGQFRDPIESTFDRYTAFDGHKFTFTGPNAQDAYGGPVPLDFDDYVHVGNAPPGDGQELEGDLMFGDYFLRGRRYQISALDLAIAADTGLIPDGNAALPEPAGCVLLGMGGMLLIFAGRRVAAR